MRQSRSALSQQGYIAIVFFSAPVLEGNFDHVNINAYGLHFIVELPVPALVNIGRFKHLVAPTVKYTEVFDNGNTSFTISKNYISFVPNALVMDKITAPFHV